MAFWARFWVIGLLCRVSSPYRKFYAVRNIYTHTVQPYAYGTEKHTIGTYYSTEQNGMECLIPLNTYSTEHFQNRLRQPPSLELVSQRQMKMHSRQFSTTYAGAAQNKLQQLSGRIRTNITSNSKRMRNSWENFGIV